MDYSINDGVVSMKVLFRENFAGGEIVGLYQFSLKDGRIQKLTADLD